MPENKNQNTNPNTSSSSQSTASSSSTSNQVKGKGKEVINVVEELESLIRKNEQLTQKNISESDKSLNTEIKDNKLYLKKPNERKELAEHFTGLDRILYDKLVKKVGTLQKTKQDKIFGYALSQAPVINTLVCPFIAHDFFKYLEILECSFFPDEIKEIVAEQQKKINEKLIAIRNTMLEEQTQKDDEIINLKKSLQDANDKGNQLLKNQQEREAKEKELLEQKQKTIKDKAELDTINANYEKLLTAAKNQEEQIAVKDKAISDYIRLINQKEQEKDILKSEWVILNSQVAQLEIKKAQLEVNLNAEKRNHEATKTNKDLKITHLENYLENETKQNQEKDRLLEEKRLAFLAVCQERDDLKNASAPKWLRKTAHWVDWALETQCETNLNLTWRKGRSWIGMLFLTLIASILLYLLSWVLRILVAVGRNVKTIFAKKQDTATVLKELVSGMKEAKSSLIKKKPKKPQELEIEPIGENTENPEKFSAVNPDETEPAKENFPPPPPTEPKKNKKARKKPKNKK